MHFSDSNYIISLDSGRSIALEEIHQHLTYAGLLEGLPTKNINQSIISEMNTIAQNKIWVSTKPYIVKPNQSPVELSEERQLYYQNKSSEFTPLALPKIACIGQFISAPVNDNFMFSSLTIVWFQEKWMGSIDKITLKEIESINWNKYAVDGDY